MGQGRTELALLFGGSSEEHDVSMMSVRSIWAALNRDRYHVIPIGITRSGTWYLAEDPEEWIEEGIPAGLGEEGRVRLNPGPGGGMLVGPQSRRLEVEVVFPVLHGPYGEDGRVQGALDLLGIPYVGSGVAASGAAMDKEIMKNLFLADGLPVTDFLAYRIDEISADEESIVKETEEKLGLPCFVKPACLGSSVGVSRVNRAEDLPGALRTAAAHDSKILVERAVTGARELECSVLGNAEIRVAGPGEIVPAGCFYDYDAKYFDEDTQLIIPASVSGEVTAQIRDLAERAFRAVTARGMARVDLFYQEDRGLVLLNEINTIPGFTTRSMYPLLFSAEGLSFGDLVDELVDLALQYSRWERGEELSRDM